MHWVIQHNMFNEEGFNRLLYALTRLRSKFDIVKVIPFSHDIIPVKVEDLGGIPAETHIYKVGDAPEIPADGAKAVIMGTYTLAEIARQRGWTPGSFHNENFDYDLQNYRWRRMLNGGPDSDVCRFADVPQSRVPFFIRPVHDSKSFIGQVMDWPKFVEWRDGVLALTAEDQPTITADTMVVVAPVRNIFREYRLWVVDENIVTASLYKYGTLKRYEEGAPPWVLDFAAKRIREWTPARAFVVDVAETATGLFVVEVNNLNCAGFYAGDMQKVVAAIEAM